MTRTLADLLRAHAAERPDAVAIRFPRGRQRGAPHDALTYAELDRRADAVARALTDAGLRPRDRLLLLARPSIDFYPLVLGAIRAGTVPVFVDPGMGPKQALRCVASVGARGLVGAPAVQVFRRLVPGPFRSVAVAFTLGEPRWLPVGPRLDDTIRRDAGRFEPPPVDPDDDAVLVFTSGSTGPAKAVAMSHRCLDARVRHIREMLDLRPGQTVLETLLVYTILELCMGLSVVVPPMDVARPATVDPGAVVDALVQHAPDVASASPVVWLNLVEHAVATGLRLPGPRMLLTTAAPIPVWLHERLHRVFPDDTQLFTPYGATEAMPIAAVGTHEILGDTAARTAKGAGTCVGRLAPGVEVAIVRVTDEPIAALTPDVRLPAGEIGEIVVRGEAVSAGYREAPEADRLARIADEGGSWHRMGDLGWLDQEGRLWFCGRKSHRLVTADGMVPSGNPEGIFDTHPAVARSAVVGVGPRGREEAVLLVELRPGRRLDEALTREILGLAAGTRYDGLVRRVLAHPRFPTDTRHNSKIRREDLRPWAARKLGRPALPG